MNKQLRIAVADDEPDMQEYFATMLPRLGHQVTSVAATGRELVEHCRQFRPDLVITDLCMPDVDGILAAQQISQELPIPIILVSAYHSGDWIERAEANFITAFLFKPFKLGDLQPAISSALQRFAIVNRDHHPVNSAS